MKAFPASVSRQVAFGAACWTLSVAIFVVEAIVQTALTRTYGLATNFISDLGNTACGPFSDGGYQVNVCSPLHVLMNGTFIAVGVLHVVGAICTRRAWPRGPLSEVGLVLLAIAGVGLILVGLAPENANLSLHSLGALFGLSCLNAAMILLGAALLPVSRPLAIAALAAGVVGAFGSIIFVDSLAGVPVGTAERIGDYPATAMVVVFGVSLLWSAVSARARSRVAD